MLLATKILFSTFLFLFLHIGFGTVNRALRTARLKRLWRLFGSAAVSRSKISEFCIPGDSEEILICLKFIDFTLTSVGDGRTE
jgi:hypothetical protein